MAGISQQGESYFISFRYPKGSKLRRRSLGKDERKALETKSIVERTIRLLTEGDISLPSDFTTGDQLWQFLRSGGRVSKQIKVIDSMTLEKLIALYKDSIPTGGKADTTISTEALHCKHIMRLLGRSRKIETINATVIDKYVQQRQKEKGRRGKPVAADTIKKELATFQLILDFAKKRKLVQFDENPCKEIIKPKSAPKERFRTFDEIEARIERGNLNENQVAELWECLFLKADEVKELLEHVKAYSNRTGHAHVYPMFAFVALTGCRRSEMMRAKIDDYDGNTIQLREKKRRHSMLWSFRELPVVPQLQRIMQDWLAVHPGGDWLFCTDADQQLTKNQAAKYFHRATKQSKWQVITGYHCLRHSFASIMAMAGESPGEIKRLMGHATDEMHLRYTHLFPADISRKINKAFAAVA